MEFFDKFKKKETYISITLQMNAKLQPMHRADFEDMVENVLKEKNAGEIVGGGSLLLPTGEISCCDIEFSILENQVDSFISFLNQISFLPVRSAAPEWSPPVPGRPLRPPGCRRCWHCSPCPPWRARWPCSWHRQSWPSGS